MQVRLIDIIAAKIVVVGESPRFIPFWELEWNDDNFKRPINIDSDEWEIIECKWDLKKKEVFLGTVKEIKLDPENFKIGDRVFFKKGFYPKNEGYISTISDIIYKEEEYELIVKKFKKLPLWLLKYFSQEELNTFQLNDILEVRLHKPYFELESGYIEKNPELNFSLVVEASQQ